VLDQFLAPANVAYLELVLKGSGIARMSYARVYEAATVFAERTGGRALDLLESDPTAVRGRLRPALDFWATVRQLNYAFYSDVVSAAAATAHLTDPAPHDGISADDEDPGMRMFIADSLRPPGLEHMNTPGPLYALREDQTDWPATTKVLSEAFPGVPDPDAPWDEGNANRTPEEAVAEPGD